MATPCPKRRLLWLLAALAIAAVAWGSSTIGLPFEAMADVGVALTPDGLAVTRLPEEGLLGTWLPCTPPRCAGRVLPEYTFLR